MNMLTNSCTEQDFLDQVAECPYLQGWYPGFGEQWIIDRMPAPLQEFLADAVDEYPPFLEGYLLPTLGEIEPHAQIISDLNGALDAFELEGQGLGLYEEMLDEDLGLSGMGNLGKSFFKKIKASVKKIAHKVIAPVKKVIEKITPKPILKIMKKGAAAITRVNKAVARTQEKIEHVGGKVLDKYGNVIIGVVGAVLAPFTGGASLAAAAALTAAHQMYQKKRAADKAKQMAGKDAAQLTQQADQAQAQVTQQVDQFYHDNQAWFEQRGITPAQWAGMTTDQKIAAINSGTTGPGAGPAPGGATGPSQMPSMGPGASQPSGGGGGGGGSDWGLPGPGGSSSGSGAQQGGPGTAQASMFGGGDMLLPALAIGAVVLLSGGGKGKGKRSSRPRRNPRRRQARRRW